MMRLSAARLRVNSMRAAPAFRSVKPPGHAVAPRTNFGRPQQGKTTAFCTNTAVEKPNILVRILTFDGMMAKYPKIFGIGIATTKTAAADLLVQKYIEKREEIDWRRVGLFTVFGFAYLGVFQYALYVVAFSRFFKNAEAFSKLTFRQKITNVPGLIDLGKQIVVDCFIHAPFIFFPSYYIAKEAIQGKVNALENPMDVVTNAMNKYYKNCVEDWFAMWKIWIPGDAFVFALPLFARLPANHVISFIYVCILSVMRGAEEEEEQLKEIKAE